MNKLDQKLAILPINPGIYIFKDAQDEVLYIGKAKVLRTRVRSYFQQSRQLEPAKEDMVKKIADLEVITTDTETEALVLEANLIRQHQPPYNVLLRDDKFYLFIKITKDNPPRIFPVRKVKSDGARYFGPYSSASAVRKTLRLLQRLFNFKGEKDSPREIIFPHPLFEQSEKSAPRSLGEVGHIQQIINFLNGNRLEIIRTLRHGMQDAAKQKHFERAALFRDQLQAIERLEGSQKVFLPNKESFDVISLASKNNQSAANILAIREGKLVNKNTFLLRHHKQTVRKDILRQFLLQYYRDAQDIPPLIIIPFNLEDAASLSKWVTAKIHHPTRGKKYQLIKMGEHNAQLLLAQEATQWESNQKSLEATIQLAKALDLPAKPLHRIETYDISNIQGRLATGSMVVFTNGMPDNAEYRRFKIKKDDTIIEDKPNDFAMMEQVLKRRFNNKHGDWKRPDLVLIDGGKGQLNAAKKALPQGIAIASIAKREEELFTPNQNESIRLSFDSPALQLVQRMRDEAHRFTITYHRLLRSKKQKRSLLDEIPGIGPKTKKQLLNHFGSLKNIRTASPTDLERVIGKKAENLRDYL